MGDLLHFPGPTKGPIPVTTVTTAAAEVCEEVLILGETADGELYYAASTGDKARLLLFIETFKYQLLAGAYDGDDAS